MAASYPASISDWTTKRNYIDIVWADHMNRMQDETKAIQETLGIIPQKATNNPGGLTPDHGTVAARIQSVARGEHIPYYRGSVVNYRAQPNVWHTPQLRADDDPFGLTTGSGLKLNETGLWMITAKCDWQATTYTRSQKAARLLRLQINGADVGVRDVFREDDHNTYALHNHLSWEDTFAKGTTISLGIRTEVQAPDHVLPAHVWLRAHLVRCQDAANGEGTSVPFELPPDQPSGEVPDNGGCIPHRPPEDDCMVIPWFGPTLPGGGWSIIDFVHVQRDDPRWYHPGNVNAPTFRSHEDAVEWVDLIGSIVYTRSHEWERDFGVSAREPVTGPRLRMQ